MDKPKIIMVCGKCNESKGTGPWGLPGRGPYSACGCVRWRRVIRVGFLEGDGSDFSHGGGLGRPSRGKRTSKGIGASER